MSISAVNVLHNVSLTGVIEKAYINMVYSLHVQKIHTYSDLSR